PAITQNYGSTVTPPANPTREGYTFAGWNPAVPATMPAVDTTCVAQWTVKQYTIFFDSNGGTPVAAITQNYGSTVTPPTNPTREGYAFAGWVPPLPATMPAADTHCVAQWTPEKYTITFDSNGGTPVADITADYGAPLTAPTPPTRTGYTFIGWNPAFPPTMPLGGAALTAQWNGQPVAIDDSYTLYVLDPSLPLTVPAIGVLSNDTDPEGNPLTAVNASTPTKGTVTLYTNGSFEYKPEPNNYGTVTFTYQANDGHGNSAPATVTLKLINFTPPSSAEFGPIPGGTKTGTNPLLTPREYHSSASYPATYNLTVDDYYIGKYEVTKEVWDVVRAWGLSNGYTDLPVGVSKGPGHPVYSVNWYDCIKWCNARSEMESRIPPYTVGGEVYRTGVKDNVDCNYAVVSYRLPSDVEWEYAARGDADSTRYSWFGAFDNNKIEHANANYKSDPFYPYDTTGWGASAPAYHPTYNDGTDPFTSPVGSFAPNFYGLYDMTGNVYEWCFDWYPSSTTDRVRRGGSWYNDAFRARIGYRQQAGPHIRNYDYGFRLSVSSAP
ncbi:MAG TPA: SUMF1/EgtB/PvdO family nonheme iron enzyme, partial [Lentisphaeria bacterium]|nr:SUMF1/EgtB/PvdO family nonheme iron enzyme [Lentisphaeria bacterium]